MKRVAGADKILTIAEEVLLYTGIACLIVVVGMIIADVVGRLFGLYIQHTIEISSYLLVPIAYLPAAQGLRRGQHVNIEFAVKLLPSKARRVLRVVTDLISLFVVIIVLQACWVLFLTSYARGLVSNTMLRAPIYLPQLAIPIGVSFMVIEMAVITWRSIRSS